MSFHNQLAPEYSEELLDRELDSLELERILSSRTDPAAQYVLGRMQYFHSARKLGTENIVTDTANWVGKRVKAIQEKIKFYQTGYDSLSQRFSKLPDNPVLNKETIPLGRWGVPLTDEGVFSPKFVIELADKKLTLKDTAKELLVVIDNTQTAGFSKLLTHDRMKRIGLDKNTASALRMARFFSFSFGRGQLTYLLPGAILLILSPNPDGTMTSRWRKITLEGEFTTLFKNKNHGVVPAVTEDEWKDNVKAIRDLLSIYKSRINGHKELAAEIEEFKSNAENTEGKERKRFLKEMNSALTIEEAFTVSIKRSLEGLISYMELSVE